MLLILIFYSITQVFCLLDKGGVALLPNAVLAALLIMCLVVGGFIQGTRQFGIKNCIVFFILNCVLSWLFEGLSVHTGFPFGNYYYADTLGPKIWDVPYVIMPTYFSMGYFCWKIALILLDKWTNPLNGHFLITVPVIAAFLMVMWNFTFDPVSSTIYGNWIWTGGGSYYGVPISNFSGWFLVCFIIFSLFSLYIFKFKNKPAGSEIKRADWIYAILFYAITCLQTVITPFVTTAHRDIYASMSLSAMLTMFFVSLLALLMVFQRFAHDLPIKKYN